MKRILLIANKSWEVEPILSALLNVRMRPDDKNYPDVLNYPWTFKSGTIQPRAIWNSYKDTTIELWCVQDIMQSTWKSSSSSQGKHADLPKIIDYRPETPDLVIALGTAGYGSPDINHIGCVVVGTQIFIHNFHPNGENPESVWDDPTNFEKLIPSTVDAHFLNLMDSETIKHAEACLLKPFLNPSEDIHILTDLNFVGLSTVNITNYKDFETSDQLGIDAITAAGINAPVGSVETTHGVIRLLTDAPFVFISGITDRLNQFAADVQGKDNRGNVKTEAQNFTAAFNIGVYLNYFIPTLARYVNK